MPATVQVRIIATDLASTMREMRMWLDHRKIVPRAFRQSTWPGGLALHVDFDEQSGAEQFADQFGGRVLGVPPPVDAAADARRL
jgi:hypothetical protein